jgi:DNA-binding transcriptional regulator LsrR (DeoR family)
MSATKLAEWMKAKDKTAVDIAAALKIHPITVQRYLKGKKVQRIIQAQLENLVASDPIPNSESRVANG